MKYLRFAVCCVLTIIWVLRTSAEQKAVSKCKIVFELSAAKYATNMLSPNGESSGDTTQIRKTLDTLYQAFSFESGKEPDWNTIRSLALEHAVFVSAPATNVKRKGVGIDSFINDYKTYVENSPIRKTGYHEHIIDMHIQRINTVANVTVIFKAIVPGINKPRKMGMDNIQLLLDNGVWKIVAFTTQSESDPE